MTHPWNRGSIGKEMGALVGLGDLVIATLFFCLLSISCLNRVRLLDLLPIRIQGGSLARLSLSLIGRA